jgi:hypothetical protein
MTLNLETGGLEMPTLAQSQSTETAIPDIGLAASCVAKGWATELQDDGTGRVIFVFRGEARKLSKLQDQYWSGQLEISARDLIAAHRSLKDRLYAFKKSARPKLTDYPR